LNQAGENQPREADLRPVAERDLNTTILVPEGQSEQCLRGGGLVPPGRLPRQPSAAGNVLILLLTSAVARV
jgi:hypothetical protein